jgi:hypothetical protein
VGEVEALAAMDEKLVVFCSGGILVVIGGGYDDLGNGPGWSTQVVSRQGCLGGPRAVTEIPQGVAFLGPDGEGYLLSRGLQVSCVSRPLRRQAQGSTKVDATFVPGGAGVGDETTTNPLLVLGGTPLRVLDLEAGQWATWQTGTADE